MIPLKVDFIIRVLEQTLAFRQEHMLVSGHGVLSAWPEDNEVALYSEACDNEMFLFRNTAEHCQLLTRTMKGTCEHKKRK